MLTRWLEERQREEGLTETEFAQSLGISQPTWNRLRNGHIRPSLRVLTGALAKYPDRHAEIVGLVTVEPVALTAAS